MCLLPGILSAKSFDEIADYIKKVVVKGDIVLTMGAGNVVNICDLIKD